MDMSLEKEYLRDIAKAISDRLPDNHGFIVLTFPFGNDPDSRASYASNANRADVINVLKEWLIKCSAEEDWMKHIK
jgi:hypothetical protein